MRQHSRPVKLIDDAFIQLTCDYKYKVTTIYEVIQANLIAKHLWLSFQIRCLPGFGMFHKNDILNFLRQFNK